jgi:hypothetical protein
MTDSDRKLIVAARVGNAAAARAALDSGADLECKGEVRTQRGMTAPPR